MALIGKPLAIVSDARLSGKSEKGTIVERLLSISGEDTLSIDRKFDLPLTCKLPTRLAIFSNELPQLQDQSGALASRLAMLPFTRSFYGKEDLHLADKLKKELPGILLWAVKGWKRLQEVDTLTVPKSSATLVDAMADFSSPIVAFVSERCVLGLDYMSTTDELFKEYQGWCKQHEQFAPSRPMFVRDLLAHLPKIKQQRLRSDGGRAYAYRGIGLKSDN